MAVDMVRLLELAGWRAFDVDEAGRVLAGSDESGSTQLVELSPNGRATALTALSGAVTGRYLPGERAAIIQHDTGGNERGQLSMMRLDRRWSRPAELGDLQPLVRDSRYVHRLLDVLPGRLVYSTNRRNGVDFDVVIRSAFTGEEIVVYNGGGMVQEVVASPDSHYLALTLPGDRPMSDRIMLVDTMPATYDERLRPLTGPGEHTRSTHIRWLPDDSGLVVSTNADRDHVGVARIDPRTGERTWLVTSEEHDLLGWLSPDGRTLLVQANEDGAGRLALHDARTGELRRSVPLPGDGWCSFPLPSPVWSPDSRIIALSYSSPEVPGDVLVIDVERETPIAMTNSAAALAGERLASPTVHRVAASDGAEVPCFVYEPAEPTGSSVLMIHGGPEGQSVRTFNPVVQALAAQGHTVLVPNVRGSTGYGKRWYSADDGRKRLDSVEDLAALHEWLPQLGLDPARSALWGGSYGGYMVLAGLAFQPQRWAAGVDIVGISSLVTFLENTSPYRRAHREREYGSLAEDAEFLREASPLTHVDEISAPLFVIHGANDPRVPLSEAEQLAEAVRRNGVECELLVFDDEGHGLAKRSNRLDAYPRALAFLARHLT
ncbi:S9 family peptidase [Saccharopolyspora gloriosae]|uniref:S9 family peptidase n=1 Tax=Saccharopolyspora gloriosae TaxID=455344 RepID=UPI001FB775FD|nr:S9 family peptidase [Saccharopolyspora gloriosae]